MIFCKSYYDDVLRESKTIFSQLGIIDSGIIQ